jgi:arginyl-tRNA synthetase
MKIIIETIHSAVQKLFGLDIDVKINRPDQKFGDFATNIAMQLSKKLNKNPREIAEQLVEKLCETGEFSEVTIAGPGFINIKIKDEMLADELKHIIDSPKDYGKSDRYKDKVVITEYSDPNPFKVLHVGHLYTSIVGDAISNLIEQAGGKVHRVNFGGDVGLHTGKTMWAIVNEIGGELPEKLSEIDKNDRSEFMARCYVHGTRAYEDDAVAKSEIIEMNKKVYQFHEENDHESMLAQIYWTCLTWSNDHFREFYNRIGTEFEKYYPESSVAALGLATVMEQLKKGVYKNSDGAVVFIGEPFGLHTRVFVNKDGLPTYEAKDVGLCLTKAKEYNYDESIIITGNEQLEYMKVVIKSIEQFDPDLAHKTTHLTHGMVKLPGGVKMASRKGNFLRAIDVLDMVADANEVAQGNRNEAPTLGAIKYAFLKNRIGADIIFEPKESVSIQGNSGPNLQYALARACSIIKKLASDRSEFNSLPDSYSQYERSLLLKITEYPDVISQATIDLAPHLLCTYLYELAQVFNRFYENSKVIGDERESVRLELIIAYTNVLRNGLKILGIPTPERM